MQSIGLHRARTTILVLALVAVFIPAVAPSAEAVNFNGCKYAGSSPAIGYRYYSVSSTWQTAFNSGQSAWDSSSAAGYFTYTPTDSTPNIPVEDFWTSSTWWGLATGGCASGGGQTWYNEKVEVDFNTRTTGSLSTTEKKLVVIHELGHAYGLAHTSTNCGGVYKAVMHSDPTWVLDNCGSSAAPYSNDVYGVNIVY